LNFCQDLRTEEIQDLGGEVPPSCVDRGDAYSKLSGDRGELLALAHHLNDGVLTRRQTGTQASPIQAAAGSGCRIFLGGGQHVMELEDLAAIFFISGRNVVETGLPGAAVKLRCRPINVADRAAR